MNSNNTELAKIKQAEKELKQLEEQYKELAADAALTAASFAPPPFGTAADVVSIGKSLWSGDWGGALLDAVGLIPVVGDTIKGATKGTKIAAKMDEVADAIKVARAKLARKKDNLINGNKLDKPKVDKAKNDSSITHCGAKKQRPLPEGVKCQKKAEQLKKNKAQGKQRELEVKKELEAEGHEVLGSEVTIKTPETNRRVDHLIKDGKTGKIRAIEVKSGNAKRNKTQIDKDNAMESKGGEIIGKNAPDKLKGMTKKIPTEVRH